MPFPNDPNLPEMKEAAAVPEEVTSWLGRLVLLYGVPLHYLVPDEEMLPAESLRFFYLDPIWLQSLVQGACSIGNTGYGDTIVDRAMNALVQPNQPGPDGQEGLVNKAVVGIRDRLRNQHEGLGLRKREEGLNWPLTGFLLRSAVVEGWRGLEIMAYRILSEEEDKHWTDLSEDRKAELQLTSLRIEQLSRDVMLGIFNGMMGRLVIRQPQEGLHFGLTLPKSPKKDSPANNLETVLPPPEQKSYTKTLRALGFNSSQKAGDTLAAAEIDLSKAGLMRNPEKRVVDIAGLAARMKEDLSKQNQVQKDPSGKVKFTSAEFAVEMIEAAGEFTFMPHFITEDKQR